MAPYQLWQLERYGNALPETKETEPTEDNRLLEQLELIAELDLNP